MSAAPLIEQDFTLKASQFRVWDLLAASILQSLPVERTEVVNDSTMRGVLRLKFGPIAIPLSLKLEVADVSPMQSFTTRVTITKGAIETALKVVYRLKPKDDDETDVACAATVERAPAWMTLVAPMQRSLAAKMFDDIRKELERVC